MAPRILTTLLVFLAVSASAAQAAEVGVSISEDVSGPKVALFSVNSPGAALAPPKAITGVPATQHVAAVDYQPSTGTLFLLGVKNDSELTDGGRLYTLDPLTGVATPSGNTNVLIQRGNSWDIDFDPVSGNVRVLGAFTHPTNLLLNPATGGTAGIGSQPFIPATGGGFDDTRFVAAGAYDNSVPGATKSTNFVVDSSRVFRMGDVGGAPISPSSGRLTQVGAFLQDSVSASLEALDISGASGRRYGLLFKDVGPGNSTMAFTRFDDTTGAASLFAAPVFDFATDVAIAPSSTVHLVQPAATREGATAAIQVVRAGPGTGPVTVPFSVIPGTAGKADLRLGDGTLQFAAGETVKTISVPVTDDKDTEDAEGFSVSLSDPTGSTTSGAVIAGGPRSVPVAIAASDTKVGIGPKRVRLSKKGVATLKVKCPKSAPGACKGTVKLQRKVRKRFRNVGSKRFSIAPGKTGKVKVKVNRAARKIVASKRKLKVRTIVTGASAGKGSITLLPARRR